MSPNEISVVVVDDHDLLRQGVIACLRAFDDILVVGDTGKGEEAEPLVAEHSPDVLVVDLVMPGMSGVDVIEQVAGAHADTRIMALTSFHDPATVRAAIDAGAHSYLLKSVEAHHLADAIRMTAAGGSAMADEVTRQLGRREPDDQITARLTRRELEIAELIAKGRSNSDIAHELSLSIFTVKNHVSQVLSKLRVKSRTEAASLIVTAQTARHRI